MALHLITGYKGEAHITSADQGIFNAGCIGHGDYVLGTGNKFDATIISNNIVRVYSGSLVTNGRQINMDSYTDVNIGNGSPDVGRNDLIVARYTKDTNTGIESAELVVLVGEYADPKLVKDPTTYNAHNILNGSQIHDMPLYRVRVVGLEIVRVECLFTVIAPLSDVAGKQNLLINGDFQINQRGETTYGADGKTTYSVDMWRAFGTKVTVATNGVTLTGTTANSVGYFTQFIQRRGSNTPTTYTISAKINSEVRTYTLIVTSTAQEKDFGTFKISTLITANNKLKVNICVKDTNSILVEYVDVFEGAYAYPHVQEDPAIAMMRCRRYIQKNASVSPVLMQSASGSGTSATYGYRVAMPYQDMVDTPTIVDCSWSYLDVNSTTTSGVATELTVLSSTNGFVQARTSFKAQMSPHCHGVRLVYTLTCEPTDS